MKIKTLTSFFAAAIIVAASISGCKKKEDDKPKDYSAATDNANANNAFAGIWKEISVVTDSSGTLRAPASGCATATITPFDTVSWPKTVILNFGTGTPVTNCVGSDGNRRRGTITAVFSGPYLDSNSVITVSLANYYHNDYHVQGTQTIRNTGRNAAGHPVYNVIVNNATVTSPDGNQTSTWSTNQNREFYEGYNTTSWWLLDDVYYVTGSANGTAANGETYTIVVNNGLRVNVGCPWVVSGKFTLTLGSYPTYPIVFDYGTGACDANATALLNGTTYNIVMN